MQISIALARFPKRSPFPPIIEALASPTLATREKAFEKIGKLKVTQGDSYATTWAIDKRTARALVEAVTELALQPLSDWDDPAHDLLFALIGSPYPELVPLLASAYPKVTSSARCAVLAVLGACGTRPAAAAFASCIEEHGWPADGAYDRVFHELGKLGKGADILFPALFLNPGKNVGRLTDAFVDMAARRVIDPKRLDLTALMPLVERGLRGKRELDCWLDLAGYLKAKQLTPALARRLTSKDPKTATFAAIALLRRGSKVPAKVLARIAANHATRSMLWNKLDEVGAVAQFPASWRTWEAFAAAEMVEWLMYPSELGAPPDALEQMSVIKAHGATVYVWRFRAPKKKAWLAAISGPYRQRGTPRPLHGSLTFSRFEPWEAMSPEAHAEAVAKTLEEWRAK